MNPIHAMPQGANRPQAVQTCFTGQAGIEPRAARPVKLQDQINSVLSSAESFVNDWQENEGRGDPECDAAAAALETAKPSLSQHAFMLHLLVRAAAELNGNPFLEDASVLAEIKQFLRQPEIAPALTEAVFDIAPDQVEIVDDLLGLDTDDPVKTSAGIFIRAADSEKIVSVMMSDVIGDYDNPDKVPEWAWVEKNSTMAHCKNGDWEGVWEFMLNMARQFQDVPTKLQPVLDEARSKGVAYVLFHQGT